MSLERIELYHHEDLYHYWGWNHSTNWIKLYHHKASNCIIMWIESYHHVDLLVSSRGITM